MSESWLDQILEPAFVKNQQASGSGHSLGVGLCDHNRLVPPIAAHHLIGTRLVEPLTLGVPVPLAILENRGRQPAETKMIEGIRLEMNAYKGKEAPGFPITSPENLVVPLCVLPSRSFGRIDPAHCGHEPGLQQFPLMVKRLAGLVDVKIFEELAERPL